MQQHLEYRYRTGQNQDWGFWKLLETDPPPKWIPGAVKNSVLRQALTTVTLGYEGGDEIEIRRQKVQMLARDILVGDMMEASPGGRIMGHVRKIERDQSMIKFHLEELGMIVWYSENTTLGVMLDSADRV